MTDSVGPDCVVVGAGPAGLAASLALSARQIDHLVLERDQVGHSWRTQRWDSLRLNNPGWMNPMLGPQPSDSYLSACDVVTRLDKLAARCPVREQVRVVAVHQRRDRWVLHISDGDVVSRTLVVASGGENVPRTPRLSRAVPNTVVQLHSAAYRSPAQLPPGGVVVVGSAQSGYQIAEELLAAGRRVVVATSPVGRAPARHRGQDTVEWLYDCGFFDHRPQDLADPSVISAPQPLLAPGGHSASLQRLVRSGAIVTGRLVAVDGNVLRFDGSAPANMTAADRYAAGVRSMLDRLIPPSARSVPIEPDEADSPVRFDPPTTLHLAHEGFGAVVWATGYVGDFSWLAADLRDATGGPRRAGTAGVAPGLWCVGLRWLTHRTSGNFLGFPADAATVAAEVHTHLSNRRCLT
jgi:putative flavoprotein involved in K+ transport